MSRCHGCGGVIGLDCFNPVECEQITRSLADDALYNRPEQIYKLEGQINQLLKDKEELLNEIEKCEQSFMAANWTGTAKRLKEIIQKHRP